MCQKYGAESTHHGEEDAANSSRGQVWNARERVRCVAMIFVKEALAELREGADEMTI